MEKQTVKISLSANLNYSALVRHIANEVFENAKFSKAWCARLKLVVDELFMNAVKYGSTQDKSLVHVTFLYDDQSIRFIIEDDGTGPKAATVEELHAIIDRNAKNGDLTRTSGRGLAMITKEWTDGLEIAQSEHGGISLSFVKRLETAQLPPPAIAMSATMNLMAQGAPMPTVQIIPQPSPAPLSKTEGPVIEVKLSGEIDQSNITEKMGSLQNQVDLMPAGGVLSLDFAELSYINSTFIGYLASLYRTLQKKQGHIRVKNINEQVKEILTLVGLINVLEIQP